MTLGYSTALRNARLDLVDDAANAGAGPAKLRIYDGTRPATGGTPTNLLAELTMGDPAFAAASGGTMAANAITGDTSADASGTATWFRIVDSTNAFVVDGSVGTSGADLNLSSTSLTAGAAVNVTSLVLTGGNP